MCRNAGAKLSERHLKMNSLNLDELIATLDIPQLLQLIKRLVDELYQRYMSEAE